MKELLKQYVDGALSRRTFLSSLGALGISSIGADLMAQSLAPVQTQAGEPLPAWMREVQGTGGVLLVAQLKAVGIQHVFYNPSSGAGPIYDALVDEPSLQPILALQEGALGAMADGFAKASGKTPVVVVSPHGLGNLLTQMVNSWFDNIPVVVIVDTAAGSEEAEMARPITKWNWAMDRPQNVPDVIRRAFKFAGTAPCAPVFVAAPSNVLGAEAKALVMDQDKFTTPMRIPPESTAVQRIARMLIEARNPILYVGDEVTWCGAQKEVVRLAELLGMPATRPSNRGAWSKPFPTRHPLYLEEYFEETRYPGQADVMLNLGGRMEGLPRATKLLEVRLDATSVARDYPAEVPVIADLKLATADIIAAVQSMATESRLREIREARASKTREYTSKMREFRLRLAQERRNRTPMNLAHLALELEDVLEKDTCLVAEMGSGSVIHDLVSFGGDDKQFFGNINKALGWGVPAAFGIKLAQPDRPVVAVVGDGAFCFGGPQPLWSLARYHAPVTTIVMNNKSYNDERNRILMRGGRQYQTGRDMACYLGDPDIDYVKAAAAYGVEGEVVREPSALRPALERAKRATAQGAPYLVDVHLERAGIGGSAEWHPPFSIKDLRKRQV